MKLRRAYNREDLDEMHRLRQERYISGDVEAWQD